MADDLFDIYDDAFGDDVSVIYVYYIAITKLNNLLMNKRYHNCLGSPYYTDCQCR